MKISLTQYLTDRIAELVSYERNGGEDVFGRVRELKVIQQQIQDRKIISIDSVHDFSDDVKLGRFQIVYHPVFGNGVATPMPTKKDTYHIAYPKHSEVVINTNLPVYQDDSITSLVGDGIHLQKAMFLTRGSK